MDKNSKTYKFVFNNNYSTSDIMCYKVLNYVYLKLTTVTV